jgi:hypothetical protein
MSTPALTVQSVENRGGDEVAYGFVYFSDETRVAYTSTEGVQKDVTGGWDDVTDKHVRLAEQALKEKGLLPA